MERGLLSLVARALGVTRGAVTKWQQVPAERVLAVEKATGIPRERLRPDLYKPRRRNGG
jgi:DNA-binding transcriptional regulator YdaS (Cro superfamily)